jgi:predicted peroxiredoxin
MSHKSVVTLNTGLEDPETVTVAFLMAVGAAETGRDCLMFLSKEAVRLALAGHAHGVACDGCPTLESLVERYERAGGRYMPCGVCFTSKKLSADHLLPNAEVGGTIPLWNWIGDEHCVTFSY